MFAHFPLRLGQCQFQSLCLYSHASCKVFTCALGVGDWYLDFSHGFVPEVEALLYNILISSVPEVIVLEEEP